MINHDEQPAGSASGWTPDRVRRLVELWRNRASAATIARSLGGGLSRSAVVGKLYRLGLTRDAAGRSDARAAGARHSLDKQCRGDRRPAPPEFPAAAAEALRPCAVVPRRVPMESLQSVHCRWPYEFAGDVVFCGHPAKAQSPYCPAHHRRAYVATLAPLTLEQVQARTFTPLGDLA